jgi:hypothetical protein
MKAVNRHWVHLKLRRDGECSTCGSFLSKGTIALWNPSHRKVACEVHSETKESESESQNSEAKALILEIEEFQFSQGTAGGSATSEGRRRVKNREDRINKKFPRAGKYLLALTSEPQSTKAWEMGAKGEVAVGKLLDSLALKYGFRVLHDRLIPKSRANIDHIAITRAGIFVIDAKNYKGLIQIRDKSSFFEKSAAELWVGNRNRMNLVAGMNKQISIVQEILMSNSIDLPVIGILTFYAAEWETFSNLKKQLDVEGVLINNKGIEAILSREGPLTSVEIQATAKLLAAALLSAN